MSKNSIMKEDSISEIDKFYNGNGNGIYDIDNDLLSHQSQATKSKTIAPNNPKAIPLVLFKNNKFIIPEEAKNLLSKREYAHIGIISLVGKYRTGKSFLLNRVILNTQQTSGFGVAPTFKPCTKGIWIWSEPLIIENNNCPKKFPCFLIDTEGLGGYDEEINHDSKIFLIAILISSLFIFNSFGAIDETAINSLSFILNLSKIIKIKSLSHNDREEELAEYFPSFLWLLRDFSLKLEDLDGNNITEKEYLESALENKIGNDEIINEKNRVRNLIKTFFPDRDCFTMVRPVEKESDLQNMQNLPDEMLRKEFLEQARKFREKVYKLATPKSFRKRALTGSMLIELVENILESINAGCIPVIENTWKYVMQSECIKNTEDLTKKFLEEIRNYREAHKNDKDFGKNLKNFTKNLYNKYINDFMNNGLIDEENKKEFGEKLKKKLNDEMKMFDKENEKLFEQNFGDLLDDLGEKFLKDLNDKEKNHKYYDFLLEFDNFRQRAKELAPDFPHKDDIIYDKVMEILRRYMEENVNKKKGNSEEISNLKKENLEQNNIINDLKKEIDNNKEQNMDEENKIKQNIIDIKNRNRQIEQKIDEIINNKKNEEKEHEKEVLNIKNKYEVKIKEIINDQNNQNNEINFKNEQLNLMKINNDKLMKLHQKKFDYYENEVKKLRDKYDQLLKETELSENKLNKSRKDLLKLNTKIKKLNNNNSDNDKFQNEALSNDLNNFMNYIQDNLMKQNEENKNMMDKIIKNKEKDCINDKELYDNFKSIKNKNEDLESKININENKINLLQDELNKLKENEDIIKSMNQFKCKNCNQIFNDEQEFLQHYNSCQYSKINNYKNENVNKPKIRHNSFNSSILNNINFDPEKLSIKVIKAKVKNDELGKPYIEYLINVKYGDKNWQIRKKFYHFANLFNNLNNKYQDFVPINLSNIFDDLNSNSSFNLNKIKQLDKFLNEIASADVINTSKPFLKFIEFEKNLNKKEGSRNKNKYTDKNNLPYKHIKNKSYNKEKKDKFNKQYDSNNYDYFSDKYKYNNNDIITNDNIDDNNYNYHKNNDFASNDDDNNLTLPEKRSNHRYTYTIISPKNNNANEHYVENEYYFNNNNKYNDYYNNNFRDEDEIIKSSHAYDNYNDYYI